MLLTRILALTLALLCSISAFDPATANTESATGGGAGPLRVNMDVQKKTLSNGMTVLLLEDHSVPMISYHTWYKVGSRNEVAGVTGAAHMLEHMMFKGSKKYANKAFDRAHHENGIENNAFTSFDMTGFYQTLPANKLDLVIDLEIDRMSSLLLKDEDLQSEREVVKEERRWRVDNNPMGLMQETIFANLFKLHPYKNPVIGTMEDISNYTVEKLRFFYENYYVPNNAVIVLVGDFDSSKVMKKIEKNYMKLSRHEVPVLALPEEPVQTKETYVKVKQNVQADTIAFAYRTTPIGHEDAYALDLLAEIMGGGPSSSLYKRLVYSKEIANSAYAFHMSLKDDGIFYLGAGLRPGKSQQEAISMMRSEVARVITKPVSAEELERAKASVMKSFVDQLETMDGKAQALATAEITRGDFTTMYGDLEKYEAVTGEDVLRVAKKYLAANRKNITVLEPKGGAQK